VVVHAQHATVTHAAVVRAVGLVYVARRAESILRVLFLSFDDGQRTHKADVFVAGGLFILILEQKFEAILRGLFDAELTLDPTRRFGDGSGVSDDRLNEAPNAMPKQY